MNFATARNIEDYLAQRAHSPSVRNVAHYPAQRARSMDLAHARDIKDRVARAMLTIILLIPHSARNVED